MKKRICVFCGASLGSQDIYAEEAKTLAAALAQADLGLVYGGGGTGLMGVLAQTLKNFGGEIAGVIPQALINNESVFEDLDILHVVASYHERKMLMYHLSDGFIILPGGAGTLEELMEHLTWMHRGQRKKPVYIINTYGYWSKIIMMFEFMEKSGFVNSDFFKNYLTFSKSTDAVDDFLQRF